MAWWRRGGSDPAPPRGDAATTSAPPASPPVQRSAWRDLPPLQPTLTPTQPIAPLDSFTSSLATAHNPSFLAPLGHVVDPDGPGGHIAGLASPVVPHPVAVHTELPVAPRSSSAAAAVQRVLAGPRMWFSDNALDATDNAAVPTTAVPPTASEPATGGRAESTVSTPVYDLPRAVLDPSPAPEPERDNGFRDLASPSRFSPAERPRRLPTAVPTVSRSVSYTAAPIPAERTVLPAVATPAAPTGALTVSRHASEDHHHDADDAQQEHEAAETVQTAQLLAAAPPAPLIGHQPQPADRPLVPFSTNASPDPDPDPPAFPEVQRAVAGGPAAPSPLSTPTQGSLSTGVPSVPVTDPRALTTGSGSEAGTVPVVQPTLAATPSWGTTIGPAATTEAHRQSSPVSGHEPAPPALRRPTGLGAPLTSAGEGFGVVQRHVADPSPVPPTATARETPTLAERAGAAVTPAPRIADTQSSTVDPALGIGAGAEPDLADLSLAATPGSPASLQRIAVDEQSVPVMPFVDLPLVATPSEAADLTAEVPSPTGVATSLDVAPLVGSSGHDLRVESGGPANGSGEPTGSAAGPGTSDPATSFKSAAAAIPTQSVGTVQRSLMTSAPTIGSAAGPGPSAPTSAPAPAPVPAPAADATRRLGVGAPIPPNASPAAEQPGDRVTVREMSLQRMFEPAAAAIASGAAYADGPGSVVFLPPAPPAATATPTLSTAPAAPLTVARSAAPRIGSTLGLGPPVQRLGIPDASSLLGKARDTAGSAVSSARNSVGSYADTARQSVGGYAEAAQQAAGGYADQARGYADTARGTLGSYADNARHTAGGYLDSARGAASSYADQAGGYVNQARGLAGGASDTLGGYADSARSAAGGYLASAQQAAGGLADSAGSTVQQATSAVGGAVDGAVDQVAGAAGGLAADASQAAGGAGSAVSGAVGAVTGAAAGAAGALPTDLDELARRLFDPLSARIRSELLLDRERAGMITDLRR